MNEREGRRCKTPCCSAKTRGTLWISVDAKNFIPSLVTPGDTITFVVAAAPWPNVPTPAARNEAGREPPRRPEEDPRSRPGCRGGVRSRSARRRRSGRSAVLNVGEPPQQRRGLRSRPTSSRSRPNVTAFRVKSGPTVVCDRLAKKAGGPPLPDQLPHRWPSSSTAARRGGR